MEINEVSQQDVELKDVQQNSEPEKHDGKIPQDTATEQQDEAQTQRTLHECEILCAEYDHRLALL